MTKIYEVAGETTSMWNGENTKKVSDYESRGLIHRFNRAKDESRENPKAEVSIKQQERKTTNLSRNRIYGRGTGHQHSPYETGKSSRNALCRQSKLGGFTLSGRRYRSGVRRGHHNVPG